MKIINPATEVLIMEIAVDSAASIVEKMGKARKAQEKWKNVDLSERLEIIKKFKANLVEDKDRLAKTLTSEMGKPISQALGEIKGAVSRIDFFIAEAEKALANEIVLSDEGLREEISFEPLGVIANISAWNYPYLVGVNVFVPALLAGNAVLYKPSEFAALTGLAIAEQLIEAGLPSDLFQLVVGEGDVAKSLLDQPVDGVFFTGSNATGGKILKQLAGRMIKVQLELGGKDPTYVCEDIDVKLAAAGLADGAFYNAGQSCCSVERIYVHEKIYDQFVNEFVKVVRGFEMGDPLAESTYLGPVARKVQIKFLEDQVADAISHGGKILCGGKPEQGTGYFFQPTVVVDVNHQMKIMREESFGPVIGIQKVESDVEAVGLMNDTRFGLTAGVYCKDQQRAKTILTQINSGSVYWNCCDRVSPRLPWAGRGDSGMGLTLSTYGIQTFAHTKAWHLKLPT